MKRFVIFPLIVGLCGTFFVVFYVSQSVIMLWPFIRQQTTAALIHNLLFNINDLWETNSRNGLFLGLLTGVGLAVWDTVRNRRNESSIARLGKNLFWCGCYALLFITANGLLNLLTSTQFVVTPSSWYFKLMWNSSAIINLTALLWAAIRSITTDDILTPRVLRNKLRERSRLNSPNCDNCDN